MLAIHDLERLGLNPIEMLKEVYDEALKAYRSGRGLTDKGDAGASYLATAKAAASDLASYKHPKLSALAIADVSKEELAEKKTLTAQEARDIIKADPFYTDEITNKRVIEASKSTISVQALPIGKKEDDTAT